MSYRRWKSFVVAIRDIEHPPGVLLSKAARIAQRFGGRLELLHVIALPYVLPGDTAGREFSKDAEIARQLTKLERMAKRLRKIGIDVKCSVVWDYPAADAIVRHVLNTRPDVVLAESHHHSKLSRWFVTHTDWELIRSCPCPLWLIKTSRLMDDLRVLAAVDPLHAHSKPAALDEDILRAARSVAAESGRVGVAHVYAVPITMVAGGLGEPLWVAAPASEMRQVRQQVTRAVDALAERYAVRKTDRIISAANPTTELPQAVKQWKANLLVMGAVSRSALKRVFIGHTAERVIDAVQCDVLIVKPRSFKPSVGRKPNAAVIPIAPL